MILADRLANTGRCKVRSAAVQMEAIDDPFMKKITAMGENYEKTDSKGASQGCRKI